MVASNQRDRLDTTRTDAVVAYLGWHGLGNLGDDAIYDAVRTQLGEATFVDVPRFPLDKIRAVATGLNRSLRHGVQVMGGGTLVGTPYFRRLATRGAKLTRGNGSYAIGAGVEDPVFVRRINRPDDDELKRWAPLLSEFRTVSVRGPRSAELLADIGLDVKVSGDPALLLPPPDVDVEDGLKDPATVATEISHAMKHFASQGHRIVGILMNRDDRRWTEMALDGLDAEILTPVDASTVAHELARCSAAVVSRLHAGILAAVSGTPVVSLEYLPKCRDFALSIDDERSLIRTDKVSGDTVIDRVGSALSDASFIRSKTQAAVAQLRRQLQAEYADVRHNLGLEAL
jgi:polysaccharide pyruvyl transferase WcaK-like protein